ncbi:MAG: AMP-binding protein, partial [Pseudomonadota bacterium]
AESGITRETDRVLLPLPLHHVYPFVVGMLAPIRLGLTLMIPYALTGPQLMRTISEGRADVIIGVPRFYAALFEGIRGKVVQSGRIARSLFNLLLIMSRFFRQRFGLYFGKRFFAPLHRRLGGKLRVLACGGAALDKELAWNLEALGWQVAVGYGLTETSPLLTIDPPGKIHPGTVGQAVRGVLLCIDKKTTMRSGIHNSDGEILAQGPGVFEGYLNLPEQTREAFTEDGWFRTGDLGWLDENGYLHLSGRVSTMIVTAGGENINPEDLEERYAGHAAIKEIGILQHDDKLVALIVPEKEIQNDAEPRIRQAIHEINRKLPSYQQLNDFALSRKLLPRTRLGKIRRKALAEYYRELITGGGETAEVKPMEPEQMSAEDRALLDYPGALRAWEWLARRYPKRGLSPDSSIELDLGMDSLEWLNFTLELGVRSGVDLDEQAIGRVETVRDLLRELIDAGKQGEEVANPIRQPEKALNNADRRWLKARGPGARITAGLLYSLNRVVMKGLFRIQVEGRERLPDKVPYILACNHTSSLDPFALASALTNVQLHTLYWSGWTGVAFNNPLTRFGSRIARVIPIDPRRGVRTSLALAASVLEREHGLIWFPEGERSTSGELLDFRPGIGLLLERFSVPVIPVVIHGTHKAMPPGKRIPSPGKVSIHFGEPLDPGQLAEEGSGDSTSARIVGALHEKMRRLEMQSRATVKES